MTTRIEVDLSTGETTIVPLTAEELAQAQATNAAWQVEETARLAVKAVEEARTAQFEEWLSTKN